MRLLLCERSFIAKRLILIFMISFVSLVDASWFLVFED